MEATLRLRGFTARFIAVCLPSLLGENPMFKPLAEVFDDQLIPQLQLYHAGFAG